MKAIKKIAKLPTNNGMRPFETVVHVTENHIEYTNGYSLIRVKKDINLASGCYTKDEMKKELVVPGSAKATEAKYYPNTDAVIPQNTKHVMLVNGTLLKEVLDVICADSRKSNVEISIEGGQMVIKCEGNMGVVMQVKTD